MTNWLEGPLYVRVVPELYLVRGLLTGAVQSRSDQIIRKNGKLIFRKPEDSERKRNSGKSKSVLTHQHYE